jgi:hypothetical protein
MLLLFRVYSRDPVDDSLNGTQHWAEEIALTRKDACHVGAERHGDGGHDRAKTRDLDDFIYGDDGFLEFFRADQRVDQIDENDERYPATQHIIEQHGRPHIFSQSSA